MQTRVIGILGGMVAWALAGGGRVAAKPAVELDLASTTAWTFRPEGAGTQAKTLPVPTGGWRLNGFPQANAGTYERRIAIPARPGGGPQVTQIAFEAVNWEATVFVGPDAEHLNEVGHHLSAWTPFRVDISKQVTPGQSALLRVEVRDRNFYKDAEGRFTIPAATEWNDRQARGILRGVSLYVYPVAYIENLFVRPSTSTKSFACEVTLVNASARERKVSLTGALSAWNPGARWNYPVVPAQAITLGPQERKKVTLGPLPWRAGRASWWWPNVLYRPDYHAQLHQLTLQLWDATDLPPGQQAKQPAQKAKQPAQPVQTESTRFGFCTPGQQGNVYTLNGVRINLRGDSLPEGTIGTDAFARLPGFLPPSAGNPGWPGAVRNYQRLHFNVIRMHQVPCTRYMMEVCDALGMLVIPETAIRGAGRPQNIDILPEAFVTHLRELVLRDRNHPSVFKWSLENELPHAPEPFVRKLYDTCREADGTRPCSIDVNDRSDYPSWPGFAVIDHYSQAPGTPDAKGGRARTDRPFGEGEYVWPKGATPQGPVWIALSTRSMRFYDNADLRPYTLIDLWPGVIPGLTPTRFPDPHLPPDSLEQGGRSLLSPAHPWQDRTIQLLQRSFAPVAVYDRDYDILNTRSNHLGEWPVLLPTLPSGKTITRSLVIFNDEFAGQQIQLRVQPVLHPVPDVAQPLPPLTRPLTVPLGGHLLLSLELPTPIVIANATLELRLSAWKDGVERYQETLPFVVVPSSKIGTQVRFESYDDKTQGNWLGSYGKQAFLIPAHLGRSEYHLPAVQIRRGSGFENEPERKLFQSALEEQNQLVEYEPGLPSVNDPRVPLQGPGSTERHPTAFSAGAYPLLLRVDASDGLSHRLGLYLLDYKREKRAMELEIYDLQGHRLESRPVTNYEDGIMLRYRFTGSVIVRLVSLTAAPATLSGAFLDEAP